MAEVEEVRAEVCRERPAEQAGTGGRVPLSAPPPRLSVLSWSPQWGEIESEFWVSF